MLKRIISILICTALMFSTFTISTSAIDVNFSSDTAINPDFETQTESLLLVDTTTDEVIFSKNSDIKRPMASITKIMTYIVTAETVSDLKNTIMEIKSEPLDEIANLDASVAGLENHIGESYSVLDILYAMMVPSGCDAAIELAYFVGNGDTNCFVDMMNEKAIKLGCENTHFCDPHGVTDENQYTTAEDMYKITKYALSTPYFRDVISTEYYTLEGNSTPFINTNYLIDYVNGGKYYYQYATGVKTGSTEAAGKCLVSTAKKGDKEYVCIALGSNYDEEPGYINYAMEDSVNLYKWAFDNFTDNINISVDKRFKSVQLGSQIQINATITDSNTNEAPKIIWSSSNPEIAAVDQNGLVTALSMGEAKIKAETQTGNFDICNVSCGYYTGIDVTSRNGDYTSGEKKPVDWAAVKNYGIDFAIIRAGWGWEDYPDQNDPSFVQNVKGAVENGITIGLNFVAYATDKETAKLEAEYLLREIDEYIPEYKDYISLPVSYDMSNSQYTQFTVEQNTEIALEFNKVMNENGYRTMCYANKSVFKNIDISSLRDKNMSLWYANYPYQVDFSELIKINDNYTPDVWQYRTDGYIPEASEYLNTKQSLIYMLSSEIEQYQSPEVTAKQIKEKNSVEISWAQVPYSTIGYSIYRKALDAEQLEKIADVNSEVFSYIDKNLIWNNTYTYYVSAKVTDFLDQGYVKEILGVCDENVKIVNSSDTYVIGDVNLDGNVNILDATEIQKYKVGLVNLNSEQLLLADTYKDGIVDIKDATQIQKFKAGSVDKLG